MRLGNQLLQCLTKHLLLSKGGLSPRYVGMDSFSGYFRLFRSSFSTKVNDAEMPVNRRDRYNHRFRQIIEHNMFAYPITK